MLEVFLNCIFPADHEFEVLTNRKFRVARGSLSDFHSSGCHLGVRTARPRGGHMVYGQLEVMEDLRRCPNSKDSGTKWEGGRSGSGKGN